jgi:G3E family GTPase
VLGKKKKPVTIITGFLGSGKTTLINELLVRQGIEGLALIVNDMGSINIDASLIKRNSVVEADSKVIEMSNGCICCTLQDAFMDQIEVLSKDKKITRILVEASGISNPASIAEGFLVYQDVKENTGVYLDSIVTVVDVDQICSEFMDEMKEKAENGQDDDPDIINLVMDQIEFCNVVLLNKCDLLSPEKIEEVRKIIRIFQKKADIVECIQGKVNPDCIFNGNKFDYDKVMNSSTIQQALAREKNMDESCSDEYGIISFVYEEIRPFDYDKFMGFVEKEYPEELIRAKGYIWFADDDMHVQLFEQAGRNASVTEASNWVAAMPQEDQKMIFENYPETLESWDEKYGDRMNQIVFIGKGYDKEKIIERLNYCISKTEI